MNPETQAANMVFSAIWWIIKVGYGLLILVFLLQIRNHLRDLKGIINPKNAPGS